MIFFYIILRVNYNFVINIIIMSNNYKFDFCYVGLSSEIVNKIFFFYFKWSDYFKKDLRF